MSYRLAVDVGGTFTDLVAFEPERGSMEVHKVPSTPQDPIQGLVNSILKFGRTAEVNQVLHGTTIATNTILERKGATVAYIATKGFRDIPFLQRANRKSHYDVSWIKPAPLVLRGNTHELDERVNWKGEVLKTIDEEEVRALAHRLKEQGDLEAIAVCLLFSYVDPRHEQRVKEILSEELPGVPVSISFEVHPKWKEYERASTTIADAYVKPLVGRYARRLREHFDTHGITRNVAIMKSNGGQMTVEGVGNRPVETIVSGPTGGVVATKLIANMTGISHIVSLDMGGTSTDVSTVVNGDEHFTTNFEIEWGIPVQVPMIDIRTIGAGGGSIAWIDRGGMLRVGPQSAGANPGPVCYGIGGTEPTTTDANLVLGRLNPEYFLGGSMKLDKAAAETAIAALGERLGMGLCETALAVVRIANNNMMGALREVLIEQGYDPRDFSLLTFGGAGPVHCGDLMAEMNIPQAIIPIFPGAFSAFGFLMADARVDSHRTVQMTSGTFDLGRANQLLTDLTGDATAELRDQGYQGDVVIVSSVEMRYLGQNFELEVPLPTMPLTAATIEQLFETFHQMHEQKYGFSIPGEPMEIVNFRVTALIRTDKPSLPMLPDGKPGAPLGMRPVYFANGFIDTPIYARSSLRANQVITGPAIIEEEVSTTTVHPSQTLTVDSYGNMIIR